MSARRRRVRLTPRAQRDYDDILLYTEATWGPEQADRYEAALDRGLARLGTNARIGVARDDLHPGLRVHPVERHLLYYRIRNDTVEVIRILHERVDPARHVLP